MSKVSVILTSYNRTTLLNQAIRSIRNQTHTDLEIFVIDDGSPDTTRMIIEDHANDDPRIIYIQTNKKDEDRKKVTDYAANINTCLMQATGKYVSYLTCDDKYYENHIQLLAECLDHNPGIQIVFGDQLVTRYDKKNQTFSPVFTRILANVVEQAACRVDHNQVMHRVSCLEKSGLWNTHAMHYGAADAIFWQQLNEHWPFYRVPHVTCEHRFHKDSIQGL